jgi:energy-coupling factor transport system ATP-binding protein
VSLSFAAVFIALRIAYRFVFGGVSWTAIGQAATLALPFALVIVICGFLSALVDVRRLLPAMSSLRFGRSVGTALAIALAAYPTLIHQVKTLDSARKLRGMRSRSAFLVPLLEHTVERAVALAAAMDLRGFGASHHQELSRADITFTHYDLAYAGLPALSSVKLSIPAGSLTVLTGATGSGKTAVLESIAGLSQHFHNGHTTGTLTIGEQDRSAVAPRETAGLIGFVQQDVRLGFAAATAREELLFGLRVTGKNKSESQQRVSELIEQFALELFADLPIELLSAGQATRVAIAAAVSLSPRILLLDEPLADLDTDSSREIIQLLSDLHAQGLTVVIAEHHVVPLVALSPQWVTVAEGKVSEGRHVSESRFPHRTFPVVGDDVVLEVSELSVSRGEKILLENISLTVRVGEIVAVVGPNGVGKSSLLAELAQQSPSPTEPRRVLVPENVASLFISETLSEELERADRISRHVGSGLSELTFWSILGRTEEHSAQLLGTHPRDLSAGTQLALAIAIQLAWKPGVVLIDEPTRGLDSHSRDAMAEVLRCVAETGTVVLFATHDHAFVADMNCRVLQIQNTTLTPLEVSA